MSKAKGSKAGSAASAILPIPKSAKFLGVHARTLSRWRRRGHGPKFVRYGALGDLIGYRLADLQEFRTLKEQGELFDPKTATPEQRTVVRKRRPKKAKAPAPEAALAEVPQ